MDEYVKAAEAFYNGSEPPNLVRMNVAHEDEIVTRMEKLGWSLWEVWGMVESEGLIYAELLPLG